LVVEEYDYPSSSVDLALATWPVGEWRRVTKTPRVFDCGVPWLPVGRSFVFVRGRRQAAILGASMTEVLALSPGVQ